MELNKKEKYIKTVLENADYKLDTDLLWNSIESRVNKPQRDRKWLWFLSGMGSVVLFLLLAFPFIKKQILAEAKNSEIVSELNEYPENNNSLNPTYSTTESTSITTNNTSNTNNSSSYSINSLKDLTQSDPLPDPNENRTDIESLSEGQAESETDISIPLPLHKNIDRINKITIGNTESKQGISKMIDVDEKNNFTIPDLETTKKSGDRKFNYAGFTENTRQPKFLVPLIGIKSLTTDRLKNSESAFSDPSFVKVHQPVRWSSFFAVKGGVAHNQVNSELLSLDNTVLDDEEFNRETGVYGYSIDIQYGMRNNRGLYFITGLDFNDKAVRYENYDNTQTSSIQNGVQSVYTSRDGETEESIGPVNEVTITNFNRRWYRNHQSLNIHFLIGQELFSIGKMSLSAEMGIQYNIVTKHKGYYFEDSLNPWKSFESAEDHAYRSSTGLGMRGGININYHINNISLGLHSFYKYDPRSLTKSDHFYNTKNNQIGLQLGLAYHLSR